MSDKKVFELLPNIGRSSGFLARDYENWVVSEWGRKAVQQECMISHMLDDSIDYRSRAIGYHLGLLHQTFDSALQAHKDGGDHRNARYLLRDAALQLQFIFDDLVFNIISLFDYIGCLIGLITEGIESHQIDWRKAIGKAKGANLNAKTLRTITEAHSSFVSSLLRYRSEISHFRRDEVDGRITTDLMGKGGDRLHITVPKWFAKTVDVQAGNRISTEEESITEVGSTIVTLTCITASTVLTALGEDVRSFEYSSPARTTMMLVDRWSRDGIWGRLSSDVRITFLGITNVGALVTGHLLYPSLTLANGVSVDADPLDLHPFVENNPTTEQILDLLAEEIIRHLASMGLRTQ